MVPALSLVLIILLCVCVYKQLHHGAVFSRDRRLIHVLHHACKEGNLCLVQYILNQSLSVINSQGRKGVTPVMMAVLNGQAAVFEFLVSKGCDLTVRDDEQSTVLHAAAMVGNVDIVKKLILTGKYNIDVEGKYGWTPVMMAAFHRRKTVFDLLIRKGCKLNVTDIQMNNILHLACMGGHADIVKDILSQRLFSLEVRGQKGWTPLMSASFWGHKEVFDLLVSKGCSLTTVDHSNNTVLHVACIGGHVNIVKYITEQVDYIERRGFMGRTPIITAAAYGHTGIVKLFIAKGCNGRKQDYGNNTILHVACQGGHLDLVRYILQTGLVDLDCKGHAGRSPVLLASHWGRRNVVDLLIRKGCNVKVRDVQNNTIIHVACMGGRVDIVKYILQRRLADIESRGYSDMTPVLSAAEFGCKDVGEFLVGEGCNKRAEDHHGNTALHLACFFGNAEFVRYWITLGLNQERQKNNYDETPLQLAKTKGDSAVLRLLKFMD